MRATLANLEKEERGILDDFKAGYKHGHSMRQHLNNIRRHRLFEACEAESFDDYCELKRIPLDVDSARRIARQGEVEQHLETGTLYRFSGRSLTKLATLRQDNPDGTTSQDIDVRKVKRVAKKALSLANGDNVTPRIVKEAIAVCCGEKPPKPLGEQLQNKIGPIRSFLAALEQLDEEAFVDANEQYPGVVKRLAQAYGSVASFLRKVQ